MTKKEIDEIADAVSRIVTNNHRDRKSGPLPLCVFKTDVVEMLSNQLAKHGSFDKNHFRRRCYS